MNRPCLGSYEIQSLRPVLQDMSERSVVMHRSGARQWQLTTGVYQAEYLREYLLGSENTATIKRPGSDWPKDNPEHVERVARNLKASYDHLRLWGTHLR